jgi:hypothetical protein
VQLHHKCRSNLCIKKAYHRFCYSRVLGRFTPTTGGHRWRHLSDGHGGFIHGHAFFLCRRLGGWWSPMGTRLSNQQLFSARFFREKELLFCVNECSASFQYIPRRITRISPTPCVVSPLFFGADGARADVQQRMSRRQANVRDGGDSGNVAMM